MIRMINSVGEYVAGEEYDDISPETADRFILLGYAEGDLSREWAEAEIEEVTAGRQTVAGVTAGHQSVSV